MLALSLLFLLFGVGHAGSGISELSHKATDEDLGEGGELLGLNLVVVVRVDRTEHGVDVLVRDGHTNVVTSKEVVEELSELASVQERVVVIVVLGEVLHDLLSELSLIIVEGLELGEGSLELSFLEVCWVIISNVTQK